MARQPGFFVVAIKNESVRVIGPDEIQRDAGSIIGIIVIDIQIGKRIGLRNQNFADSVGFHLIGVDRNLRKGRRGGFRDIQNIGFFAGYLKENAPEKPEGEQDDTQQPPEKPDGDADDDSADQPELPEIGGGLDEVQLKNLLDAGVITQEQYDAIVALLDSGENAA